MSLEEFLNNIRQSSDKIASGFERLIPLMVGNAGKSHFKTNFQKGGFVDQNLKKLIPKFNLTRQKKIPVISRFSNGVRKHYLTPLK